MRIALYHPWVYLKGGAERTVLELITRSRHDWTLFTGRYAAHDTFPEFRDLDVRELAHLSVRRSVPAVAAACMKMLVSRPDWRGYDALMISCEGIGNLMAYRAGGLPTYCLCHTPLKVAYDPWTRERWLAVGRPGRVTRAAVRAYVQMERWSWQRYQRILCVSNEVQRRVLHAGLATVERTEVVHPGVDIERLKPTGRRESFFFMPGRIMWSKNLELGLQAFIELKSRFPRDPAIASFRMVVAGMVDTKSRPYLADLRRIAAGRQDIEFITSPCDEQLWDLYDRCHSVLFTPLNEDWGLVPLEAMAFGKPVISVGRGGPAESIVHEGTGLLCPPVVGEFSHAMQRLVTDERLHVDLSRAARCRAGTFHWSHFAARIDDLLERHTAVAGATPRAYLSERRPSGNAYRL